MQDPASPAPKETKVLATGAVGPLTNQTDSADPTLVPGKSEPVLPPQTVESPSDAVPHRTLGQYELLELLGQGGMGAVYKARHKKLNKLVALKVLPSGFVQSPQAVSRFEREMKAVGIIDHPNIVRAMDAGDVNGTHYLAMELVEGSDLTKLIKQRGPFSVKDSCKAIRQAALGLDAAHKQGLVHRDIKPANLLLAKTGQIKILDLGLARIADEAASHDGLTSSGQVLGTPDYMAPEQWEDTHTADLRTDLYALGCTLFYLLVGRAPFATDNYKSVVKKMDAHVNAPIPDLKAVRDDVPNEVNDIYRRLMAKRPEDRFATAGELAGALAPFATSKPGATKTIRIETSQAPATPVLPSPSPGTESLSKTIAEASSATTAPKRPSWANGKLIGGLVLGIVAVLSVVFMIASRNRNGTTSINTAQNTGKAKGEGDESHQTLAATPVARPPADQPYDPASLLPPPWSLPEGSPEPVIFPMPDERVRQIQAAWGKHLGQPVVVDGPAGTKFALIPPGEAEMTLNEEGQTSLPYSTDRRLVRISRPYRMSTTEVTYAQFKAFVDAKKYSTIIERTGRGGNTEGLLAGEDASKKYNWRDPGPFVPLPDGPVVHVTPLDAAEYCKWLSTQDGQLYRLPTEAEWQWAARGGNLDADRPLASELSIGHFAAKLPIPQGQSPVSAVARLRPNSFGLYDVLGNVREWTMDYAPYDRSDPWAIDPVGPAAANHCGTSFAISESFRKLSARGTWWGPASIQVGFRVVREVIPGHTPVPSGHRVRYGEPLGPTANVARPATIPGLRSWSVELSRAETFGTPFRVSPDGKWIANRQQGAIHIRDADLRLVKVLIPLHRLNATSAPNVLSWSNNGRLIVAHGTGHPSAPAAISVWDVEAGQCLDLFTGFWGWADANSSVAFSPDGRRAFFHRHSVWDFTGLRDVATGQVVEFPAGARFPSMFSFAPDGARIVGACDPRTADSRRIDVINAETLATEKTWNTTGQIVSLDWSRSGDRIVAATVDPPELTIWDGKTFQTIQTIAAEHGAFDWARFSPDGSRVMAHHPRGLSIYRVEDGKQLTTLPNSSFIWSWFPDGQRLAAAGRAPDQTAIWDIDRGETLVTDRPVPIPHAERKAWLGGTGQEVWVDGYDGTLLVHDSANGRYLGDIRLPGNASDQNCLYPTAGGRTVIWGWGPAGQWAAVYDRISGRRICDLKGLPNNQGLQAAHLRGDGERVAGVGNDGKLYLWYASTGEQLPLSPLGEEISGVAWATDGKRIFTRSSKSEATQIWDTEAPDRSMAKVGELSAADFSGRPGGTVFAHPDARTLFVASGISQFSHVRDLFTVDAMTGAVLARGEFENDDVREPRALSSDGTRLASRYDWWATSDGVKRSWELTGAENYGGSSPEFLTGGRYILVRSRVGGGSNQVVGFDLSVTPSNRPPGPSGRLGTLYSPLGGNPGSWLLIGPDGHYACSAGAQEWLVYVAMLDDGSQKTFTPAEFEKEYGWKNDPSKARLLAE